MKNITLILLFLISITQATVFTVPGDYSNINDALVVAQPGDTVNVSGIHNYDINTVRSGTSGNLITINGGGTATIRQMNFKHAYNKCIGFSISGRAAEFQASAWFWTNAHYCVLQNCLIDNQNYPDMIGIGWKLGTGKPFSVANDTASNCQILGNTVTRVTITAMLSMCGDDNLVEGNSFIDGEEIDFVRIVGRRNIIRGNIFRDNHLHPTLSNHPDFIQCFGNDGYGSRDHIIEGNLIDGIEGGQVTQLEANLCPDIEDWTFQNNIFMNISNGASCTVAGIKYYNNLFYKINYGLGSQPLSFGTRYYAQNRVDPSNALYSTLGDVDSGEIINEAQYYVYMSTTIPSGTLVNGTEYVVDGSSSGYITYNGVQYKRREIFTANATTTYTITGSMSVYKNGTVTYNGVTYNHNTYFIGSTDPNFTINQYDPLVRVELPNKANGARVIGNVFIECGDSRQTVGWYGIATDLTDVQADYNYVGKTGWGSVTVDAAHRSVGSAGGWGYWWEDHGINGGDPGFVNFANLDFRLSSTSILKNAGVAIAGLTKDKLNVTRPQGVANDIGPYEYESGGGSPGTAPIAPSALTASSLGTTSIRLSWTDNSSDETLFTIERSLTGSTWFQPQSVFSDLTAFDIVDLQPSTTYYFRIKAINSFGESSWTSTANATTDAIPVVVAPTAALYWDANPTDENITSYKVYEVTGPSPHAYTLIGETIHTYFSVTPVRGVNTWVIRAVNSAGEGSYSDPVIYSVGGVKSRRPKGKVPSLITQ